MLLLSFPFALLIIPFERVVRNDGTQIVMAETLSTKKEVRRIAKTITSKLIVLSALWALWSFFYRQAPSVPLLIASSTIELTNISVGAGVPT